MGQDSNELTNLFLRGSWFVELIRSWGFSARKEGIN